MSVCSDLQDAVVAASAPKVFDGNTSPPVAGDYVGQIAVCLTTALNGYYGTYIYHGTASGTNGWSAL